ncbi:MAG: copper resistance protein CopD [Bacteroidetes bacterium HGW-Bacteroidetes-23]|nr:MAG: copper resistance protein CopD [Bacteroidetes bacterium HGW-Bacteroidetes-23]
MLFKWLIVFHVLGAAIWIGGHLILCIRYLPESLKNKDPDIIRAFEKKYEIIGLPSLLVQIVTGIWIALTYYNVHLFGFANPVEQAVSIKLILLLITLLLAVHVRFFVFPKLTAENLWGLALHIIAVTLIAVLMLYFGVTVRFGGV